MNGGRVVQARKESWADWVFRNRTSLGAYGWGLLPLRLMLAVIFIVHGSQKAFGVFGGPGWSGTVGMISGTMHWPAAEFFAVLLIAAELGGGLFLLLGFAPRIGAFGIAAAMVVALLTVHRADGFFKTHLQQLIVACALTLMIAGSGPLSVMSSHRKASGNGG